MANSRREAAMLLIDEKINEYQKKYRELVAEHGKCLSPKNLAEIIAEVAQETYYDEKTLKRYYNYWMKKRGVFALNEA